MKADDGILSAALAAKTWILRALVGLAVIAGLSYGTYYLFYSFSHESTDDAYVAGTIVPVAAEIKGRVVNVYIKDNQNVSAGDPLLDIFPQDYQDEATERSHAVATVTAEKAELEAALAQRLKALAQAVANRAAAAEEEALAEKDLVRYARLFKDEVIPRSKYDSIESILKVARARKEAAVAAVEEAQGAVNAARARLGTQSFKIKEAEAAHRLSELNLKRTALVAPISGIVAKKNVDPGKYVQPGQALLAIVQQDTWIVANFKETQIDKMTVAQPVEVRVDAYPGTVFKGHIDSIQAGTGAIFSLLPPENATGNFVKVVQRLPVKIVIDTPFDPAHPLWPGLSVIPTVDVSRQTGSKLTGR